MYDEENDREERPSIAGLIAVALLALVCVALACALTGGT